MKFMKLGARLDTFYTKEDIRTVSSDTQSDLTVRINCTTYLLHQHDLLPKCGLLRRLFSSLEDSRTSSLVLHDVPGGDEAFELCAKFCYAITIEVSAHNFITAFCAAKFLRMTDEGNFVKKLEKFFSTCILKGWKDSIVALGNTEHTIEWCEHLGITRRCLESVVGKISTPPAKVTWSYTYTRRPRHENRRRRHSSAPKDWWTEDLSLLGPDTFKRVIITLTSTNTFDPRLTGEALHVYACRHLVGSENESSPPQVDDKRHKSKILDMIVNLIPPEKGSVSIKFLMRLLAMSRSSRLHSHLAEADLVRLSARQLDEAGLDDLLSVGGDVDLVATALRSFLRQWRRLAAAAAGGAERNRLLGSVREVAKTIDRYLQVVAGEGELTVPKVVGLIESLPAPARPHHDDVYRAIDIYLKEHPDVSKADKRRLCRVLESQKLSMEARGHAVRNERLPLRTVVQILFSEQDKGTDKTHMRGGGEQIMNKQRRASAAADALRRLNVSGEKPARRGIDPPVSEPGTNGGPKRQIKRI